MPASLFQMLNLEKGRLGKLNFNSPKSDKSRTRQRSGAHLRAKRKWKEVAPEMNFCNSNNILFIPQINTRSLERGDLSRFMLTSVHNFNM